MFSIDKLFGIYTRLIVPLNIYDVFLIKNVKVRRFQVKTYRHFRRVYTNYNCFFLVSCLISRVQKWVPFKIFINTYLKSFGLSLKFNKRLIFKL